MAYRLPECLRNPYPPTQEALEWNKLYDDYEEKFGRIDWDDYAVHCLTTESEIKKAIRQCLEEGKQMKEVRPEWYMPVPENLTL